MRMTRTQLWIAVVCLLFTMVSIVVDVRARYGFGVLWTALAGFVCGAYLTLIALGRVYDYYLSREAMAVTTAQKAIDAADLASKQFAELIAVLTAGDDPGAAGLSHFTRFAATAHIHKGTKLTEHELEHLARLFVRRLVTAGVVDGAVSPAAN